MTTLTQTAYLTRKLVNIGVILLIAGVTLWLILGLAGSFWQKLFPAPPPPPTRAFGILPVPNAQNNLATPSGQINYTLETVDGTLPILPPILKVYFMPRPGPSFGSFERMQSQAGRLGFRDIPQRIGATAWRFVDKDNPLRVLDIDEVSGNFRLTYNFLSDQSLFGEKNFTATDQAVSEARSFFENLGVLSADFKTSQPAIYFYKLEAGALVPATSIASAEAIGVTFSRGEIDTMPVVSPDFKQGLQSVILSSSSDTKKKVLEARYLTVPVDWENFATYAPLSSPDAWERLRSGRAVYASLPNPMTKNIIIRKVYVAYLDSYPSQSYFQPVMVFSDEKGFMAYVPLTAQ